uniref:Reverse transcriptase domain-containing protein n=1 Tax=Tanacetum cinerariifolium TaxID=118510 RepID=A0A6L2K0P9_TANCI|nr:reverse transcriptase domain-containing protein [Tanacetum cinerariifolium]
MEELLQAPTEGYGEAIIIPKILAENFEIKTNLLQLVQTNKFHGFKRDNPYTHISNFKRITSTLKYRDVPNDEIKLMLFSYSLEGAARIWDSSSKTDDRIDKLADQISNIVEIVNKQVITPATAKAVEKPCVICGASTLDTLLGNTVPNPKGEMKGVTTSSGLAYERPSIPTNSSLEKVVERDTKEITDKQHPNYQGSIAHVQPLVVPISISEPDVLKTQYKPNIPYPSRLNDQKLREKATNQMEKFFQIFHDLHFDISFADALLLMQKLSFTIKSFLTNKDKLFELGKLSLPELTPTRMTLELADRSITRPKRIAEDVFVKVGKFHFPTDFVVVDFEADSRVPLILRRSFLRTDRALIDVYGEEITLRVNDESYNSKSSNPTLVSNFEETKSELCKDPIVKSSSPTLTPFGGRGYSLSEKLLNDDPFQLPPMEFKQVEETKEKSSIEEPPELELKELLSHVVYAFLEDTDKLPVIIAKDLKDYEKEALIKVLKSHKWAIAWKISDIKGIDPRFCTHKILMEEDYKPTVQSQRQVNPKIHDVIKKEVIKLLDARLIYPISDSPWANPIHCVPKKGGMNVVTNENNELIPTRLVTGWRVCIDYRKLNDGARKDHFPLPFMDQILERLAENEFYCFLDGFLGPMTHLLEKETPFVFSKDCVDAFDTLKKQLTEAPILGVPDWNLPFELICDASDFAIGAVLGQN